jgi:hypothetical protein
MVQPHVPSKHAQLLQPSPAGFVSPGMHSGQAASVQLQVASAVHVQLLQPSSAVFVSPGSHGGGQ